MNIQNHFEESELNIPFDDGQEETYAYLRWLDMFLLAAQEIKDGADEEDLRRQLRRAAVILGSRVAASAGSTVSAYGGMGISGIASEYGLYDFSFFCLLMAVAPELDAHYLQAFSAVSDYDTDIVTFALAEDIYSVFAESSDLSEVRTIKNAISRCPLFTLIPAEKGTSSLLDGFKASRQLSSILKGDYIPDEGLNEVILEEVATGASEDSVYKKEADALKKFLESGAGDDEDYDSADIDDIKSDIIHIKGVRGSGRKNLVLRTLDKDTPVLFVMLDRLALAEPAIVAACTREILVRVRILNMELAVICEESDHFGLLLAFLRMAVTQKDRVFVITGKDVLPDDAYAGCRVYPVEIQIPSAYERQIIWEKKLSKIGVSEDVDIKELAGKYRLFPGMIKKCAELAWNNCLAHDRDRITEDDLSEAVLYNTTIALDALSDRIPLKFTWDDLVIEESQRIIMKTLCSRVKNRSLVDEEWGFSDKVTYGKGVSLILYGPPGTGKTMAAQVMARDIGMALYRVDLSQLVDKYVGETEKNINRIFNAASDGNVILFFDEADALFSKRTEVSSSNDKHANTEVAFLLQKMEQHEGVTILATNRFSDFDAAFVRRINYTVRLERPDAETRLELFKKILPDKVPLDKDVNLKYYADNFELSGSEIKEVLYSAAFIAAADNQKLGHRHILQALKYQQEKTGKIIAGAELARYI